MQNQILAAPAKGIEVIRGQIVFDVLMRDDEISGRHPRPGGGETICPGYPIWKRRHVMGFRDQPAPTIACVKDRHAAQEPRRH